MSLAHFSLFSGIGGIDLAAEWAGFETVGQCEWADYPTRVLEKHWPNVPRWRDIRSVTGADFQRRTGRTTVDLVSGGFPCQPFSVAGQRKGKDDDRFLWPEMCRVITELRPTWVLGENVAGIVSMALDQVCSDLEDIGYEVQPFIIPAASVNAQHKRERCFIVANANAARQLQPRRSKQELRERTSNGCEVVADTMRPRGETGIPRQVEWQEGIAGESINGSNQCRGWATGDIWAVEPAVGRVANGIPARVDRLKCLGNAVVPQQVYPILKAIAEIESSQL